jgi:hypothetical protein
MASRIGSLTQFAPLSPPWQLTQLDANFTAGVTAFNDSSLGYSNAISTDTGTANNYIVALPYGSPTGYNQGMLVTFIPANSNSGASTITVSPLGSAPITDLNGNALSAGLLVAGQKAVLVYIGTSFCLTNSTQFNVKNQDYGVFSTNTATLDCTGFSRVNVSIQYTGAGDFTLTLNNLGIGTYVTWNAFNSAGGQRHFIMAATIVGGTQVNPISAFATGLKANMLNANFNTNFGNGQTLLVQGAVTTLAGAVNPQLIMSYGYG